MFKFCWTFSLSHLGVEPAESHQVVGVAQELYLLFTKFILENIHVYQHCAKFFNSEYFDIPYPEQLIIDSLTIRLQRKSVVQYLNHISNFFLESVNRSSNSDLRSCQKMTSCSISIPSLWSQMYKRLGKF